MRRAHIGVVTQGSDLVPFLTAQESVELALAMRGEERHEVAALRHDADVRTTHERTLGRVELRNRPIEHPDLTGRRKVETWSRCSSVDLPYRWGPSPPRAAPTRT